MPETSNPVVEGIEKWTNKEVLEFLTKNEMGALVAVFEENEVTGLDLVLLTEDEMRSMLNISKLQAAKVKKLIATEDVEAEDSDPAKDTDFNAEAVPRISERPEDLADDDEDRAELQRATTGVRLPSGTAPAPPTDQMANLQVGAGGAPAAAAAATPPAMVVGQPAPGPFLPAGTGALQLDYSTVERFQTSMTLISKLEAEGVAQSLPAARSRLQSTRKRLALQEKKFDELSKEEAKQDEKLDKLTEGKWYPGKFILGKKRHEEKISKRSEKREAVSNQVRAAGAQLEELNAAVSEETKRVHDLTVKCQQLDEARSFCSSLLQTAFAGGAVGDARENVLETEVAALGPKIEEVRRYKTVYGKAYELMRASREACNQAHQQLQAASGLAAVDVASNFIRPMPMRNSMGGLMVDMIKRNQMRQGVQLCKVAAEAALRARDMVPDMPRVKAEKLKELRVGFGLFDVVFDNMVSDLIVAAKIRKMIGTLRSVLSDIEYAERWLHGWISGRIDQDLRTLEGTLATKRSELHAHRMHLLQNWIEARSQGAVTEAPVQRPPVQGFPTAMPPQPQPYSVPQPPAGYPAAASVAMQQPPPGYPVVSQPYGYVL